MPVVFSRLRENNFDLRFTYHADAILHQDFPRAAQELDQIISGISIQIAELIRGGGGEAQVTQRLRGSLNQQDWKKRNFRVERKINDEIKFAESHEVDHIKKFEGKTIALEIEWNNKDPFFDRDLENFNRLHADGAISIGIIVTRGRTLQSGIEGKIREFAVNRGVASFGDLEEFGIDPTRRQRQGVIKYMERNECSFAESWSTCFVRDKFGTATTHWAKLETRLDRGVGSPCPIVAIGIPLNCIFD